jgi:hypothetical protein
MAPAKGQFDLAGFGERAIAGIAIDLQHASEALEMGCRTLGLAVRRVDIGDRRRRRSAPRSVVTRVGPELAGLGPPSAGIEHRGRRLVGEQLGRSAQLVEQPGVQWSQPPRTPADPVGERRAVEIDSLAGIDLGLPVERKMIGVLGDDDVGEQHFGR